MKSIVIKTTAIVLVLLAVITTAAITQSGTASFFGGTSEQDSIPASDIIDLGSAFVYPPTIDESLPPQAIVPPVTEAEVQLDPSQALPSTESAQTQNPVTPILEPAEATQVQNPSPSILEPTEAERNAPPHVPEVRVEIVLTDESKIASLVPEDSESPEITGDSENFLNDFESKEHKTQVKPETTSKKRHFKPARFSTGNYVYIQVGSFSKEEIANQVASEFASNLQSVHSLQVVKMRDFPLYRVLSGPIEATHVSQALSTIKEQGYPEAFTLSRQ